MAKFGIKMNNETENIIKKMQEELVASKRDFRGNKRGKAQYERGRVLGMLYCYTDLISHKGNGEIHPNRWAGLQIKEKVTEKISREVKYKEEYWAKYNYLCKQVKGLPKGYGIGGPTAEECVYIHLLELTDGDLFYNNFGKIFPDKQASYLVKGFAEGYSYVFYQLADICRVEVEKTDPLKQDIFKNWQFFAERYRDGYRLDGRYYELSEGGKVTESKKNLNCYEQIEEALEKKKFQTIDINF